ncbi:IS1096 element passenger TnpR family protein [Oceanisphaera pacifica]|uniref:Plasmid pRiA4b Orf3-like domain-containing protein n=1 Tax=Oceanisphaera pacifica TaxID=2818389 RepID=A0ABS3NDI8_9GAMM|nr:hypothetical protein [Oceanisphaera pacifica]MBO1518590.1 hypothetical protein [Oceanisphaera pacifica]
MIITLTIKLVGNIYTDSDWSCELEVDENIMLYELHDAIQEAVDFDNDHLFSFFTARNAHGSHHFMVDDEKDLEDISLLSLFPLRKGYKLFYWFDFGDDWIFQVSKSRKKPRASQPDREYPFLVSETGTKPEQYPSFEDDDNGSINPDDIVFL